MKKVEKVSIGKYSFTLEEDAYKTVNDYLTDLQSVHPKEVMEGIEERMAELFIEKCPSNAIVTYQVAVEVIGILGKPEVFEDEKERDTAVPKKKLYRDMRDKVVAGVCSGLAAFFNMDAALMRLLWSVVFFVSLLASKHQPVFGFMVLAYIVLWICMPKADTVQKQYEMRGKKITVDDIANRFESGVVDMSKEVRDNNFMKVLGRVLSVIVGIILLVIGVSGIVSGCFYLVGFRVFDDMFALSEWFSAYFATFPTMLVVILANMVYFIPMVGMLYGGVMMVFNLKSPRWKPGLILFILWLLAIIALAATTVLGIFVV